MLVAPASVPAGPHVGVLPNKATSRQGRRRYRQQHLRQFHFTILL